MTTMTFVVGMERFNAHVWDDVQTTLHRDGLDVVIRRFNDDHVNQKDPSLVAAIHESDVLFLSLLNFREQAEWLERVLAEKSPKAVFAFESMPEVMALNKVGDYRVKAQKGVMPKPMQAILSLITRGRDEDTLYAYTKLTKVASRLLPLMPPKLADFRTWLTVNIYWNQPEADNIVQMVRLILRDCLGQPVAVKPVRAIPMMGCFHPDADAFFPDPDAYLKWAQKTGHYHKGQPLVAMIAIRKHLLQKQAYIGELVRAVEAKQLATLPIFVSGIEAHVAVREWIARRPVDVLLSTMGFSVVGGPAASTKPGHYHQTASDLLASIDVPYLVAQPLLMQSVEAWRAEGINPFQGIILFDLPEMDGSTAPVALGAIKDGEIATSPDRVERAATQVAGWARLRRTPTKDRKIAVVVYNFPPGLGKLGTAALLDVPASLHVLFERLRAEGYDVGRNPTTVAGITARLAEFEQGRAAERMSIHDYRRTTPRRHLERIERQWGTPPGDINPVGNDALRVDGFALGNVFIGVQPPMGVPGDPMRLLFDKDFTPHHQYVAFYRWLTQVWKADAIVHFGMHGTAEWMPGLQMALTDACWPDFLLGDTPQLYLYPLNNPAESTIARRRGYATVVSHAIPPYARAGLYKQLAQLRAAIADHDDGRIDHLARSVPELARRDGETEAQFLERATAYLDTIESRLIADGLHVLGAPIRGERAIAWLEAALDVPRNGNPGLTQLLRESGLNGDALAAARTAVLERACCRGENPTSVWRGVATGQPPSAFAAIVAEGKAIVAGLAECSEEVDALVHALGGGYVRPAIGADPIRAGAGALPSGRNIHSIDPWRLPSDTALERGRQMAEMLLARHLAEHGRYPETVAQTLWALDTIKSEGEALGVVLALVGATPERDGQGKIFRYALLPLERLGRPRVDMLLDVSSVFRDTFQLSLDLLDALFQTAATADESNDCNFIKAHVEAMVARGVPLAHASARVFSQQRGRYGTGVDELVEESAWEDVDQLATTYLRRNAFAYGGGRNGAAAPDALRAMLGTVQHVFQPIDSVEFGLTDMQHYYGHSGAVQLAARHVQGVSAPLTYAESFTGVITMTDATELVRIEARTKLLNPRWYEALLAHGYSGATEIGNRFTHLLGWGAVSNAVEPWVFDHAAETYVLDETMRARLEAANPAAAKNAVARLLEANGRGLWPADEATIERLHAIYGDLEDRLEGVAARSTTI